MDEDRRERQPFGGAERERSTSVKDKVVVFEVSGYSCGLPMEQVREIVPMCDLARPPGLPPLLEGFLNLRGEITPVLRMERLFGLSPIILRRHTQIIVLHGETPLALLADEVRNVVSLGPDELLPASDDSVFNDCVEGVLFTARAPVHVLRVDRLLLAQEKRRISEHQEIEHRRLMELEEADA